MKTQIELHEEIMKATGITIVNCGSCGDVMLYKMPTSTITCPYCDFTSEPCDFPDFLYVGMEINK